MADVNEPTSFGDEEIFSAEQLLEALRAAGADSGCPVCGHLGFMSMGLGGELEPLYLVSKAQLNEGAVAGYTVYGVWCDNCGAVVLFRPETFGRRGD